MLELALFAPWIFFLFVGALDWGFLASSLISLEAGTRTAALYTSTSATTAADSTTACTLVIKEMYRVPNIGNAVSTCGGTPLTVTASFITGPDSAYASKVSVTYRTIRLIPIPGILRNQYDITRTVTMRLRS
jgi:Flp pilus assembly protein TadG